MEKKTVNSTSGSGKATSSTAQQAGILSVPPSTDTHPCMPPIPALKQGLVETLNYFSHLAGQLATINDNNRHRSIVLNVAGVRVVEARVHADMEEPIPAACPSPKMTLLHPPINDVEELLPVQFNQFKCGGMAIVLAVRHHVGDG